MTETSFNNMKLSGMLLRTCQKIQYYTPTPIQKLAMPSILKGESVIANAETGSGKTATFGLPLIQKLSSDPFSVFALIIAPSRELAIQIHQQMAIFGQGMNLRQALLIGGLPYAKQIEQIDNYPHVVVGTPGRISYMMEESEKLKECLERVEMMVLDEADRLFEESLLPCMQAIVHNMPDIKQVVLATATIDENFEPKKLQQLLSLKMKFVKHSTFEGIKTVSENRLSQFYVFTPEELKSSYLLQILKQNPSHKIIIFLKSCRECTLMSETLKSLGFGAVCLHSFMKFNQRLANLAKFRVGEQNILVTTDLTSRGLDINQVNLVINYHMPRKVSDYVHRVGRTARNGYQGEAISFITQYEQELLQSIEQEIQVKMDDLGLHEDLQLVATYNKTRREVKINLMSSGVLVEMDKKIQAKREKKMEMKKQNAK